jgi:putative sterol carrier protein
MDGPPSDGVATAIEWMRKHFDAESAPEAEVVYQFELVGESGGAYALSVSRGHCHLERGRAARPDAVLRASVGDWLGVLHGRENADLLYMAGRLEIEGDLGVATRLRTFFRG